MSAGYVTTFCIKGTKEELRASLGVLKGFEDSKDVRLEFIRVGKMSDEGKMDYSSEIELEDLTTDEEMDKFLDSIGGSMMVDASGPYGYFYEARELAIFEPFLDAAPSVSLTGEIEGYKTGFSENIWCKTEEGKLHIYYRTNSDDEDPYFDYLWKKLPFSLYREIFKIPDDEESYLAYEDIIGDWFEMGDIYKLSYDKFAERVTSELEKDGFEKAKERIRELSVQSRNEYDAARDWPPDTEAIYDPVTKERIRRVFPYCCYSAAD